MAKKPDELTVTNFDASIGFELVEEEDLTLPRLTVVNALSAARENGANEGDVINSLTGEKVNDKLFIPFYVYYSNTCWNPDANAEDSILCTSADGKTSQDGQDCKECGKATYSNARTECTRYMNIVGCIEDEALPAILSFSRTSYKEGTRVIAFARSLQKPLFGGAYKISTKKIAGTKNKWYVPQLTFIRDTDMIESTRAMQMHELFTGGKYKVSDVE